MKSNELNSKEPQPFELSRCQNNSFTIWASVAENKGEFIDALRLFRLGQIPILLRQPAEAEELLPFSAGEPSEMICLNQQGKIIEIISLKQEGKASRPRRTASVLFTRKGFADQFGVEADRSLLLTSNDGGYLFRKLPIFQSPACYFQDCYLFYSISYENMLNFFYLSNLKLQIMQKHLIKKLYHYYLFYGL